MVAPRILVVDDEFLLADMLASLLEDSGYEVMQASNGRNGFELASQHGFDLIITDFMMPLMTGLEMAEKLKADQRFASVPILLVSGAQGAIARARPDLFVDVFDKPFNHEKLVSCVASLVGSPA